MIRKTFPAIIQAIEGIGSPQIIAMGTVGGDLCQRPRCWYYRQGFGLLGQLDGKSLIPEGDNRYHAIFGNEGPAYFVSASSLGPPLIALGATLEIVGARRQRTRTVPVAEFLPRAAKRATNAKQYLAAERNRDADFDPACEKLLNATYEVRQRQGLDWPLVTASVAFPRKRAAGRRRSCWGTSRPTPWRVPEAAAMLDGKTTRRSIGRCASAMRPSKGARPLSKNAYKVRLVKTAVKRAILAAVEQKEG